MKAGEESGFKLFEKRHNGLISYKVFVQNDKWYLVYLEALFSLLRGRNI